MMNFKLDWIHHIFHQLIAPFPFFFFRFFAIFPEGVLTDREYFYIWLILFIRAMELGEISLLELGWMFVRSASSELILSETVSLSFSFLFFFFCGEMRQVWIRKLIQEAVEWMMKVCGGN